MTTDTTDTDETDTEEEPSATAEMQEKLTAIAEDLARVNMAEDEDGTGRLAVLANTFVRSNEHYVGPDRESVAELNPDYPEDDLVLMAAYEGALDEAFGDRWREWPENVVAYRAGLAGVEAYSFPESRLAPCPTYPKEDEAEGEEDD